MVLAAVNEALRSAQALVESKLGAAMGGCSAGSACRASDCSTSSA